MARTRNPSDAGHPWLWVTLGLGAAAAFVLWGRAAARGVGPVAPPGPLPVEPGGKEGPTTSIPAPADIATAPPPTPIGTVWRAPIQTAASIRQWPGSRRLPSQGVSILQTQLRTERFDPGAIDGAYGAQTHAAVLRYLAAKGGHWNHTLSETLNTASLGRSIMASVDVAYHADDPGYAPAYGGAA